MDPKEKYTPRLSGTSASCAGDDDPTYLGMVRSSSAATSMDSYMQSLLQQHQQQKQQHTKGMIMNTICPQLPPPVAMSLRARETASMSLKHIFDQQMNNGASREQECKSTQGQQMGGFQGMRNQSMPDLRKRVPELDLSYRKAQDSNFAYAQTGFGSPISTPTTTNQSLLSQSSLPMNSQLLQHNHMPQAAASARLNPSSRLPTAQMTIFYSGNVNVYDDVPADKAHAIMLLAGNTWSPNFRCHALPAGAPATAQTEVMPMKEPSLSPIIAAPSQQHAAAPMAKTNTNGGGIARNVQTPASSTVSISLGSPPPSPALAPLADGTNSVQSGVPARRPHAGIELPHARKASLARFLEKRKDRVQVQEGGAVGEKGAGEGGESGSCNGKPDHPTTSSSSNKKQCTRSPSPSRSTSNISNRDNSATNKIMNVDDESPSQKGTLNEHCFFH